MGNSSLLPKDSLYFDKRVKHDLKDTTMVSLATMLFDSAVHFEYSPTDATTAYKEPPRMDNPLVKYEYERHGMWFKLFATLPYDATFSVSAMLDCLRHCMKFRELDQLYMVESLQLGFPFCNRKHRYMWVHVIDTLLYNFNIQFKFMMQHAVQPQPLRTYNWHCD